LTSLGLLITLSLDILRGSARETSLDDGDGSTLHALLLLLLDSSLLVETAVKQSPGKLTGIPLHVEV